MYYSSSVQIIDQAPADNPHDPKETKQYRSKIRLLEALPPEAFDIPADLPITDRILIHSTKGFDIILISEILYLQAEGNYTHIHIQNYHRITTTKSICSFENILACHHFLRIHQSYLININHVRNYDQASGKTMLFNDQFIPVARRKKQDFVALIEKMTLRSN
jgi:DNA-binding LytR/AlgR family response regulator